MFDKNSHTFCICAYGESEFLEECIRSTLLQRVSTNVIVATSTPNKHIEKLCRKYHLELFVKGGDPGIGSDWNFALSCAETPLATVAHQDDVYEPMYSEILLRAVNSAPRPLLFFSNYAELRNGNKVIENNILKVKRRLLAPLSNGRLSDSKFVRRRILSLGSAICCPSVSFVLPNLPSPVFKEDMKCNLDWQAWESVSRLEGDFLYSPEILMLHRIHEESETTALIHDNTRTREDIAMFKKFWPAPIALLLNKMYAASRDNNEL